MSKRAYTIGSYCQDGDGRRDNGTLFASVGAPTAEQQSSMVLFDSKKPPRSVPRPVKFLQARDRYSMLSKRNGEYFITCGTCLSSLQEVERTSVACLVRADGQRSGVNENAEAWLLRVRVSCLDGDNSNPATEAKIVEARPAGWNSVAIRCEDHLQSLVFSVTK